MNAPMGSQPKVDEYIAERRRLGFELKGMALALAGFASFVGRINRQGPLAIGLMADWARQDKVRHRSLDTCARRPKILRPFARWPRQFDPDTATPDALAFGPVPGRVAPHIYREAEIVGLLAAAHRLNPQGSLRPATYETLFGLIASAGLRVSEALPLLDSDVGLINGTLTVRQTKFATSRQLPLHPCTAAALGRWQLRRRHTCTATHTRFFVGPRGRRLGEPLGNRQVHPAFNELRRQLGWKNRGAHDNPRIHGLRHSFAVRRAMPWHERGIDVGQAMLALSTYLGQAKTSNTYWYLTGVPELMALAGGKFENFAERPENCDER